MAQYRPGDLIEAEIEFQHAQVVRQVFVLYEHREGSALPVVLTGEPWVNERSSGGVFSSGAHLNTVVPQNQEPGTYQLREIVFETFTGQRLSLSVGEEDREGLSLDTRGFRIIEEPGDPPRVRKLRIIT